MFFKRDGSGHGLAVLAICAFPCYVGATYADTFTQQYSADGADHFMEVYLESCGTHAFKVNGVPYGTYHYVGYRSSGGGYSEEWTDTTTTGWDPSFSTYVCSGYHVKLVVYNSSWDVMSVYYWNVHLALPDLIAQGVSVSDTTVTPGQSVSVSWTAGNLGTGNAGSTQQGVMWSGNSTISRSDSLLDEEYLGPLSAGHSTAETHTVTIPSNVTPGAVYYIGVYADYELDENESDESNNGSNAVAVTVIAPDLIAYGVSVSDTTVNPGQSITVNWSAKNDGSGSAGSTQQGVMWSSNTTISRSDDLLGKEYLGPILAGHTSTETRAVTIPSNVTVGATYYIGVYADYDLDEDESDEDNNGSGAVAVTINGPDLLAYSASVSDTTVLPGQSIVVSWTAKNNGSMSAGSTQQGVVWSSDSVIARSDELLGKEYLGPILAGHTSTETRVVTIPADAMLGATYYIGVYADYDLDENETNENNNHSNAVGVVIVAPDLTISQIVPSAVAVERGEGFQLSWTVKNQGSASAGGTQLGLMWSTNATISRSDHVLETSYIDPLGVNQTQSGAYYSLTAPSGVMPGETYYIGVYADYGLEEDELDENNNGSGVALTIKGPDLTACNASATDTTVQPGQSITISWIAKNDGSGDAGSTQQGLMWSVDNVISRADGVLGNESLDPMGAGQTSSESRDITIPGSAVLGATYYIGVYADYNLEEDEINEDNNSSNAIALTVVPPEPVPQTWYRDADDDDFGDAANSVEEVEQPIGYVVDNTDCDDADDTVYPGAPEPCDGVDHNCDGHIKQVRTWCRDVDGDGYGDGGDAVDACEQPWGHVADCHDCDDEDSEVSPGGVEKCNDGIDNDCDGLIDCDDGDCGSPPCPCPAGEDCDGDGVCDTADPDDDNDGDPDGTDCAPCDALIHHGASEVCNDGVDNDCDGQVDEADRDCFITITVEVSPSDGAPWPAPVVGVRSEPILVVAPDPKPGMQFDHWSGDGVEGSVENPLELVLRDDMTITAVFVPVEESCLMDFCGVCLIPAGFGVAFGIVSFKVRGGRRYRRRPIAERP